MFRKTVAFALLPTTDALEILSCLYGYARCLGLPSTNTYETARKWGKRRRVHCIAGNHEEMFLESFTDREMLRHFLKHGGRETVLSYGIKRKRYNELTMKELVIVVA